MGCFESKMDPCKRSKAWMRRSISAHAAFADANSAYASALKNTGAAFSDYFASIVKKKDVNLFKEVDDSFINASQSAYQVSRILDYNKLQYHRSNFGGLTAHSTRFMRVVTLNMSSRRQVISSDPNDYFVCAEKETLATILDKMLEWEKKLYKQSKDAKDAIYAYQREIASLNKLGGVSNAQATVKHLDPRYIVGMQSISSAINSTITEINRLRDEQLYPKFVQLIQEMATMWENMQKQHELQSTIIQALPNFQTLELPEETSAHDLHNMQQLHHHVKIWSTELKNLMLHQNSYIKSLENWLEYNLVVSTNHILEPQDPKIEPLLHSWLKQLEKLPKEDTMTAMEKFSADIHTIAQLQSKKRKMKKKCDETRKELFKVLENFERWCNKDIAKNLSTVGASKLPLAVEQTYEKLCVKVKDRMVVNLTTRLPVFLKDVSGLARDCSLMYKNLNV